MLKGTRNIGLWKISPQNIAPEPNPNLNPNPRGICWETILRGGEFSGLLLKWLHSLKAVVRIAISGLMEQFNLHS